MSRADSRAWLGVVLAGTVLAYVGCSTSKSTAPGSGAAAPSHELGIGRLSGREIRGRRRFKIEQAAGQLAEAARRSWWSPGRWMAISSPAAAPRGSTAA